MWIRLDCPNGHPVKVDGKFAGRMGRCPACGAKVRIPDVPQHDMSEDAILDILGPAADPVVSTSASSAPVATQPVATKAGSTAGASHGDDIHSSHSGDSVGH